MSIIGSRVLGGAGQQPYLVGRSLRFRASASAYLNRTPAATGSQTTWTWSGWVKRGAIPTSVQNVLFGGQATTPVKDNYLKLAIGGNDALVFNARATTDQFNLTTTQVFRDPSAWYHFVVAVDTTQATSTNRIKIYVNGVQVTAFATATYPSLSYSVPYIGVTSQQNFIGRYLDNSYEYLDGYLTEINFINGQALTASSFGAYDNNGVWQPIKYGGTYGTNGFYLNFSDNSAATAAAIGKDYSGNGNNWTPNNFDITSNAYRSFTTGTYGWTAPAGVTSVNYLIVAGGGGGGNDGGGGGGAGGVLTGTATVTPGTTYSITVGAGGAAATNGSNSVMSGTGFTTLTAVGGGKGGSGLSAGSSGGSGGGGGRSSGGSGGIGQAGGAGTAGQGNNGGAGFLHVNGAGGGGGGAGAAGTNATNTDQFAGNGGIGIASTITGSTVYYGGGGGGGAGNVGASNGTGGTGGGGNGGGATGSAGTANTGGGGGGGQFGGTGGAGGSGIIILSYTGALQAGTTYDSMIDSPTVSASSSNYAVLNPLANKSGGTISGANLNYSTSNSLTNASCTIGASSGKYYFETTFNLTDSTQYGAVGITTNPSGSFVSGTWPGLQSYEYACNQFNGNRDNNGVSTAYGSSLLTAGDIMMCAFDMDNGKIWWGKNGTWFASGDPASGTNAGYSGITGTAVPLVGNQTSTAGYNTDLSINFGQRPFAYTPPTGFNALNTYNLPQPTIMNGAKYMQATLYTGNGSATQTIAQSVTGNSATFLPDFVWTKGRSGATNNIQIDTVRGGANYLISDSTSAEAYNAAAAIQSFSSNGYVIGNGGAVNTNAATYVAWQWNAGSGTTSTNTNGSISSLVSVNASAGFSIVSYVGTGSGTPTVGHGLGVAPSMIIVKSRSNAVNWGVGHTSAGWANAAVLNATNTFGGSTYFAATAPTSTVFSIQDATVTNISGATYIAYCWSAVAGYSAFGSYVGNASTDGPFVYLGFRPRYLLMKSAATANEWYIWDTARNTYNTVTQILTANSSAAESTATAGQPQLDILSNGFKVRDSGNAINSTSMVYAAFAENPFKVSRAR